MSLDFSLVEVKEVLDVNLTHNLGGMADACGLYEPLWRACENDWEYADDIIKPLEKGIANLMVNKKELIEKHTPENGWGNYDQLKSVALKVYAMCVSNPELKIEIDK